MSHRKDMAAVTSLLRRFGRRRRTVLLWRGLAEGFAVLLLAVLCVAAVDALLRPDDAVRAWLTAAVYAAGVGVACWRGVRPWRGTESAAATALRLEAAADPQVVRERLSSAVELDRADGSERTDGMAGWMIGRTIAKAAEVARQLRPRTLVPAAVAWRAARRAGAAAVVVALLAAVVPGGPAYLLRAVAPWSGAAHPLAATFLVTPGDVTVDAGAAVRIEAVVRPAVAAASLVLDGPEGEIAVEMAPQPADESDPGETVFVARLTDLQESAAYRIRTATDRSIPYRLTVRTPPRLRSTELLVIPPQYVDAATVRRAGLAAGRVEGHAIRVLAGSSVRLRVTTDRAPLAQVEMVADGGPAFTAPAAAADTAAVRWRPETSGTWKLRLTGRDGMVAEVPQRWLIDVQDDLPPTASLAGGEDGPVIVGPRDTLALAAAAEDDLGLASLQLVSDAGTGKPAVQPLSLGRDPRRVRMTQPLAATSLAAVPGQHWGVSLRAADGAGQEGASEPIAVEIATAEVVRSLGVARRLEEQMRRLDRHRQGLRDATVAWQSAAAHSGDLPRRNAARLLAAEASGAGDAVADVAGRIQEGRDDHELRLQAFVQTLGDDLAGWAGRHPAAIVSAAETATTDDGVDGGVAGSVVAQRRLEELRTSLALAQGWFAAHAMEGRSALARDRATRTLDVLLGRRAWTEVVEQSGLAFTFYAGKEPQGEPRHQDLLEPWLENFEVPGLGKENWSTQASGEVYVPEAGRWRVQVRADDGVRMTLDGKNLFGDRGWHDQSPTDYEERLDLAEGWHPITLSFYQGWSGSELRLKMGKDDRQPERVRPQWLRSSLADAPESGQRAEVVRLMSDLPPAVLAGARYRVATAAGVLTEVPKLIGRIGDDIDYDGFRNGARAAEKAAETLTVARSTLFPEDAAEPVEDAEQSAQLRQRAVELARNARETRQALEWLMDRRQDQFHQSGLLGEMQRRVVRLREDVQESRKERRSNDATLRREEAKALAEQVRQEMDQLRDTARRARSDLLRRARQTGATATERAALAEAARTLDDKVARSQKGLDEILAREHNDAGSLGGQLHGRLGELEKTLKEAAKHEEQAEQQRIARLAKAALPAAQTLAEADPAAAFAERKSALARLEPLVEEVVRSERAARKIHDADNLAQAMPQSAAATDVDRLRHELQVRADRDQDKLPRAKQNVIDELRKAAEAARKTGDTEDGRRLAAEALELAEVDLALEAERLQEQQPQQAEALRDLAGRVAEARVGKVDADTVDQLAKRAADIAGRNGGDRQKQAFADAAKPARDADADQPTSEELQGMANRLAAATRDKDSREAAAESLREAAARPQEPAAAGDPTTQRAAMAAAAAELADKLERQGEDAAARRQELATARQAFAASERDIAAELKALAGAADQPQNGDDASGEALGKLEPVAEAVQALAAAAAKESSAAPRDVELPDRSAVENGQERIENLQRDIGQAIAKASQEPSAANAAAVERLRQEATALRNETTDRSEQSPAGLAAAAEEVAEHLQRKVVEPLARAAQNGASRQPDDSATPTAATALGPQLAGLVARQREAAGALRRAVEATRPAEMTLETDRQGILAAATGQAAVEPTDEQRWAARQAQNMLQQARNLQRNADQAQTQADAVLQQAEELVAQGPQQANAASQRAEQALQAQTQAVQTQAKAVRAAAESVEQSLAAATPASHAVLAEAGELLDRAIANSDGAEANAAAGSRSPAVRDDPRLPLTQASAALNRLQAEGTQRRIAAALSGSRQALEQLAARAPASAPPAAPQPPDTPTSADAVARAAAQALAAIEPNPNDGNRFRQAARIAAAAARQARLNELFPQPPSLAVPAAGKPPQAPNGPPMPAAPSGRPATLAGVSGSQGSSSASGPLPPVPAGIDEAEWARLSPEVRQAIRSGAVDQFDAHHQKAIRDYYRRLGTEQ